MKMFEVNRVVGGRPSPHKTLINLNQVKYIEEGTDCIYVYFTQDSVPLKLDISYSELCKRIHAAGVWV